MLRIAIVTGTRPGRLNETVARWVLDVARRRADIQVSLVDVGSYGVPPVAEGRLPTARLAQEHLRAWSRTVASFDGFVFVTPEYLLSSSTSLNNAIGAVANDWRDKPAGFVGYGAQGAVRSVEELRRALAAVGVATVAPQVSLTLVPAPWPQSFVPDTGHVPEVQVMLEQVVTWSRALKSVRGAAGRRGDAAWRAATPPREVAHLQAQ